MVAVRSRRFFHAARWNGSPPHSTTGVARASETHIQPANRSGGTIASTTTGTVSSALSTSRSRRDRVWPGAGRGNAAV